MRASTWFHASPAGAALLRKTGEPMPLAFERIGRQRKAVEMGFADNPGPVYFDAAHVQVSERLGHLTPVAAASGITTLDRAYDVQETRSFWKVRGIAILMTFGLSVLILLGVLLMVFGSALASALPLALASSYSLLRK